MRESQGEDEGVLEVHAWTEHASAPASGTRLDSPSGSREK